MSIVDESDWVFRDRHPERTEVYARFERLSAAARARPGAVLDLEYGPHPRERLDMFPCDVPGAPVVAFFHGGYWQGLSKELFSFVASAVNGAGCSAAIIGYPLAPDRSLPEIVNAASRGVDAAIVACAGNPAAWMSAGHSAGAHLALRCASVERQIPLAGVIALSPICDLRPLRGTSLDRVLNLTDRVIADQSPLFHPPPPAPVRLLVGADETPGFLGQAQTYVTRMRELGGDVSCKVTEGLNHYTIPLEMIAIPSAVVAMLQDFSSKIAPARTGKSD